ncbi:tRNA (adenosine(37)-N6)-dimethylallyltransferase MiaA [Kangiella sp. HZ709]|uniref:tRNA (adenosine(37)-N6)-dimethylallyltransferase MiaA n=1 Tax=Kangiella sp. HZ709 TaxID=2666328 RepID=UPI0012AF7C9A|nr:tRNA (adenosine(37)-N6)-dimethylallyltransferase MiaA [Kangiella sp. HZ709]MRX27570.1 tRNA (adenosine(37)-N6)-dimethylallyltransferase MiaA [Kangiella sp. HZ709]
MGPTAAGKTELAIKLVQEHDCEIISVDSAMVYKSLDIGSAKPSEQELALAPHRLIDICDPSEPYSAARFRDDALRQMAQIVANGKIPLLVGGTMLYYKTLLEGMNNLPDSNPDIRQQLQQELNEQGLAYMHQKLNAVDSDSAKRINANDPQRILRALEVFAISGKPLSQLHNEQETEEFPYDVLQIALLPSDRAVLHQRIEQRFHQMIDQGLLDEVQKLYQRGDLNIDLPAIRSVGYRQIWQFLAGELSKDEAIERAIIATRQLAKRQFTWLRSWSNLNSLQSDQDFKSLYKSVNQLLKNFLHSS